MSIQSVIQAYKYQGLSDKLVNRWIQCINHLTDPETSYWKYRYLKRWLQQKMPKLQLNQLPATLANNNDMEDPHLSVARPGIH